MQKRKWALCARTLILMLPALLLGQSERGTISGLVKDPSGAVVVNAKVTVTNTATNNVVVVNSTQSGDYTALSLQAGTYTVRVEAQGFQVDWSRECCLNASTDVRADATLEVGTTTTAVEVQASALQTCDGKRQGERRHHQQTGRRTSAGG